MEIKAKNTGWGLAIIIQTPNGHTYLYDTGPGEYTNEEFNEGRDVITPFLKKNGISFIDGVVISHPHKDHFGGFNYLNQNFKIAHLYDAGYSGCKSCSGFLGCLDCEAEYDSSYKREFIAKGGSYQVLKQLDTLRWDDDLEIVMLSPPQNFLGNKANVNSVILRIKYEKTTFLLTGDLSREGQQYVMNRFDRKDLQATVMSAPHHGDDSFPDFAETVMPKIVISSSLNGAERPARKAKEVFEKAGAKVYATCWNGTVQVVSDGNTCVVLTERDTYTLK